MGCVGPHGVGLAAFAAGLAAGRSAIRTITVVLADALPVRVAGGGPAFDPRAHVPARDRGRVARVVPMALLAAREALAAAGLDPDDLPDEIRRSLHVLLGSGAGCVEYAERQYAQFFSAGPRAISAYAVPCST